MGMADAYLINEMIQHLVQMPSILTDLGGPSWLRGNARRCTTVPRSSYDDSIIRVMIMRNRPE